MEVDWVWRMHFDICLVVVQEVGVLREASMILSLLLHVLLLLLQEL